MGKKIFKKNNNNQKGFTLTPKFGVTRRRGGFTLIETLIYIAIIGAVVTTFINFTLTISEARNKTYTVQEVHANSRTAVDLITQKIRQATGVNIGLSVFDTDPGELSLIMASPSLNPTIINLDRDNGVLQIKEGVSDPVSITSNKVIVSNLVFRDLTASSTRENIRINLIIDYNTTSSDVEYNYTQSLQTSVSIRQ